MSTAYIVIGIILIVLAVFLIVCVLKQQGKERNLSGAIAGGQDNYMGRGKTKSMDKILSRITLVFAILFTVIVTLLYVLQYVPNLNKYLGQNQDAITGGDTSTTTTVSQ